MGQKQKLFIPFRFFFDGEISSVILILGPKKIFFDQKKNFFWSEIKLFMKKKKKFFYKMMLFVNTPVKYPLPIPNYHRDPEPGIALP